MVVYILKMRFPHVLIVVMLLVPGCAAPKRIPLVAPDMNASFIRDFERKYAGYRISSEHLPASNLKKIADPRKAPLWENSSAKLSLHLGNRTGSENGRFRTSSRYELRGASGALLGSAESVLASADLKNSDLEPSVRIAFDPTSRKLLVVEEHSWSVQRIILLSIDDGGEPVRYVRIPTRQSWDPVGHYKIVAFLDGKIFVEQDNATFAFPLDVLKRDAELEYSIGRISSQNPESWVATSVDWKKRNFQVVPHFTRFTTIAARQCSGFMRQG